MYVRSQTSPKQSLGKRATTYPGQAPLSEIFLAELSGDNVKVQAAEAGGAEDKALGKGGPKRNEQRLDLESGTRWTAVGNKKLLVAGESCASRMKLLLTNGSICLGLG